MRAVLLVMIVGCGSGPYDHGDYCGSDADCGGQVCGRDEFCHDASELRGVRVMWTVNGGEANATSCAPNPDFYLEFDTGDSYNYFGYAPVPCMQGSFFIDKIPNYYNSVLISLDNGRTYDQQQPIDSSGTASFNLAF
ncbi:MAG: hypothetical protein QM831_45395 [Kofleriaceae bacterium]